MNKPHRAVLLSCLIVLSAWIPSAWSAEPETKSAWQSDPHGWVDIQPAAGLAHWTRIAIPPTNKLGRAQWHLDAPPGVLTCDGDGGHDMLRFDQELGDCIFHVEFSFVPVTSSNRTYNSGVFIRNSSDGAIWHQAQLKMDGGYLFGNSPTNGQVKRFRLPPASRRTRPAGEWNELEVTARGKTLSLWLNGAVTCTWSDCEVPKGYVALESEGFKILFRNLKLKEL